MGLIRNPNWSTSEMRVTLLYLGLGKQQGLVTNYFYPSKYSKIVSCPPWHLTYALVIGGAYPYMDLNAKYEKLTTMFLFYYD
jgi:hypothetical protein